MQLQFSNEILGIISRLEGAGHEAYVVGGSLRDALLGRPSSDTDMTTSALPEETATLFSHMRVIPTGIKHGTVTVLTDSGTAVEITTFRTDGAYTDSRHPDSVSFTRSLEEDLARRDFTVNAMAYAPERGLVDVFGGREDLKNRLIRCVGDPERRFTEDALRILRAFRFSAQLGFSIEKNTLCAALKLGDRLSRIARERVCVELFKLLSSENPSSTLALMSPIMITVLPEVEIDPARYALCDGLPRDPVTRLALLISGSGKATDVAGSLRLSNSDRDRLSRLSVSLNGELPRTPVHARRLLSDFSSHPEDAVTLVKIDGLLKGRDTRHAEALLNKELASSPCLTVAALAVNGGDLMASGLAQGKKIGKILGRLLEAVIEDPSLNEREALIELAGVLAKENNL